MLQCVLKCGVRGSRQKRFQVLVKKRYLKNQILKKVLN